MMAMVYGAEGNNDQKKEYVLQGLFMMYGNVYQVSDEKVTLECQNACIYMYTTLSHVFEYL